MKINNELFNEMEGWYPVKFIKFIIDIVKWKSKDLFDAVFVCFPFYRKTQEEKYALTVSSMWLEITHLFWDSVLFASSKYTWWAVIR